MWDPRWSQWRHQLAQRVVTSFRWMWEQSQIFLSECIIFYWVYEYMNQQQKPDLYQKNIHARFRRSSLWSLSTTNLLKRASSRLCKSIFWIVTSCDWVFANQNWNREQTNKKPFLLGIRCWTPLVESKCRWLKLCCWSKKNLLKNPQCYFRACTSKKKTSKW